MVRWCIRLTRLTLVCEVIRYRLVQVRHNLKTKSFFKCWCSFCLCQQFCSWVMLTMFGLYRQSETRKPAGMVWPTKTYLLSKLEIVFIRKCVIHTRSSFTLHQQLAVNLRCCFLKCSERQWSFLNKVEVRWLKESIVTRDIPRNSFASSPRVIVGEEGVVQVVDLRSHLWETSLDFQKWELVLSLSYVWILLNGRTALHNFANF